MVIPESTKAQSASQPAQLAAETNTSYHARLFSSDIFPLFIIFEMNFTPNPTDSNTDREIRPIVNTQPQSGCVLNKLNYVTLIQRPSLESLLFSKSWGTAFTILVPKRDDTKKTISSRTKVLKLSSDLERTRGHTHPFALK